jgi:hypothetical protein
MNNSTVQLQQRLNFTVQDCAEYHPVQVMQREGCIFPAGCTGLGKCWPAGRSQDVEAAAYCGAPFVCLPFPFTPHADQG